MAKVNVIDSIMGSGKTSYAIQMMNERADQERFLYITPFLDEVQRVINSCPAGEFAQPQKIEDDPHFENPVTRTNKLNGLKTLLSEGRNISSTHALFKRLDEETIELIERQGYILVMDEVMNVVENLYAEKGEIDGAIEKGILKIEEDPENPLCPRLLAGEDTRLARYQDWWNYAKDGRLVMLRWNEGSKRENLLMWLFPASIFKAFKEVWNITYLFDGQQQRAFYDLHGVEYTYWSVIKQGDRYELAPHDPRLDLVAIDKARGLMEVYYGRLNETTVLKTGKGKHENPLSKNWLRPSFRRDLIRNKAYNWLRHEVSAKASDVMWTTFKTFRSSMTPRDYKTATFVSLGTRATNDYRSKTVLCYLANNFLNPDLSKYFELKGVKIDEDQFALNEFIQWAWRSAIRDGHRVKVFLPAERMRIVLGVWFGGNYGRGNECRVEEIQNAVNQ